MYRLLRFAILVALDIAVIWFLSQFIALGYYPLAAAILVIAVFVNIVFIRKEAYPIRWMVVGLILMAMARYMDMM